MSRQESEHEAPVWSALLVVNEVPPQGLDTTLEADSSVREKLAALNGLQSLSAVTAKFHAARRGREGLHVKGEVRDILEALVRQRPVGPMAFPLQSGRP